MISRILDDIAHSFGKNTREAVELLGSIGIFFWRVVIHFPTLLLSKRALAVEQMMRIGIGSLPIVLLMSVVTGFIITWQFAYLAASVVPLTYLGMAVAKASLTEMGPTFTALVLSARVSAKLAAELGTMKVTEQFDAMTCLSLDPFLYMFSPRVLAGFVMTTVLFIFSSAITILSSQFIATMAFDLNPMVFYNSTRLMFKLQDVVILLVKGFVFGGILTLVGCYYGYITKGGAVGVGESTKNAVVAASVLVLMVNVVINQLLM
jgi:phospholipid/cholesterol/gamma-HCH transport system permease protein